MCNMRIALRKIRKVLELYFNQKLSQEKIGYALNISRGAVREYIMRYKGLGKTWQHLN